MASAIIHLAVAKELSKYLKIKNLKNYYIGSIAPDLSKILGLNKEDTHFLRNSRNNTPNIELFIMKYPDFKHNDFDLGYFIHLYTDKLWTEDFIENIKHDNSIKLLDGTVIETTKEEMQEMIYSDYTNLNIKLIEEFDLDLEIFYEDFIPPETTLSEIPVDKLDLLINKMGLLIENTKENKPYTFDTNSVSEFIKHATEKINERLKEVR